MNEALIEIGELTPTLAPHLENDIGEIVTRAYADFDIEKWHKRMARCGQVMGLYRKRNGEYEKVHMLCGGWRNHSGHRCTYCFDIRKKSLARRMSEVVASGRDVWITVIDSKACTKLVRQYGKENVARFPGVHQDRLFIACEDEVIGAQKVTTAMIAGMDWAYIVNTPGRKNVSGGLGRKVDTTVKEKIKTIAFVHEGITDEQDLESALEAIEATSDLHPTTAKELEAAIEARRKAHVKAIEARGGKVVHEQTHYVYVELSVIDWITSVTPSVRSRIEHSIKHPSER